MKHFFKCILCLLAVFSLSLSSCNSDDNLEQKAPAQEYLKEAKDILSGDIVLST